MIADAAIGAFNVAVGLNRQKHARVAVPRFVFGTGAMQRQILRCDVDNGIIGCLWHDDSLAVCCLLYDRSAGLCISFVGMSLANNRAFVIFF